MQYSKYHVSMEYLLNVNLLLASDVEHDVNSKYGRHVSAQSRLVRIVEQVTNCQLGTDIFPQMARCNKCIQESVVACRICWHTVV